MSLPINLPDGRVLMLDENTGSIIGEQAAEDTTGPAGNRDDWWRKDPKLPPPPGGTTSDEFDPNTDQVTDVVNLPGGKQISYIKNGQVKTTFISSDGSGGGVSATTAYAQQQANARDAASLAEQQRQFNEQYHFDKAKFNTSFVEGQRQFNEGQELERGKTLLGLQNQPGTLYRYLHALGGNLPPQALGGTNPTLPGFNNLRALGGSSPTAPAAPTSAAPVAAPRPAAPSGPYNINPVTRQPDPGLPAGTGYLPGPNPYIAGLDPKTGVPTGAPKVMDYGVQSVPGTKLTQGMTSADLGAISRTALATPKFQAQAAAEQSRVAPGQKPRFVGPGGVLIYKDGGVVPEPVMGVGLMSGMKYMFGEQGTETVVPEGKDVEDVQHLAGEMMGGGKGYAIGGTIGFDPNLFNPSSLPGIVQRGFNSDPGVPLFPDVGVATGGGASLIPSAQRLNSLLPSQQQSYAGFLQDEAGVQSDDVFSLAQKISSGRARGLSTPRYV